MDGTTLVVAVVIGVLLGAASSVVTRRAGVIPGAAVAAVVAVVGLSLIGVVGLGPVLATMFGFTVTAAILDPPSEKLGAS